MENTPNMKNLKRNHTRAQKSKLYNIPHSGFLLFTPPALIAVFFLQKKRWRGQGSLVDADACPPRRMLGIGRGRGGKISRRISRCLQMGVVYK